MGRNRNFSKLIYRTLQNNRTDGHNRICLLYTSSQSFDWNEVADICPKDAYEIKGTFIDPQTLTDKLLRDKDFYDESMGGVTFSGGEPALQPDFIIECAKLLHQNNIHVALDTAGCIDCLLYTSLVLTLSYSFLLILFC